MMTHWHVDLCPGSWPPLRTSPMSLHDSLVGCSLTVAPHRQPQLPMSLCDLAPSPHPPQQSTSLHDMLFSAPQPSLPTNVARVFVTCWCLFNRRILEILI